MRNRQSWRAFVTAVVVGSALVAGTAVPAAFAAKPPKGDKPVPPGQPFQALLKLIEALGARVDALEAAAPQEGLLWINPLALQTPLSGGVPGIATASFEAIGPAGSAGLVLTASGAGSDVVQAGVQVPLGFVITGVRVCYVPGPALSFVSGVQLFQFAAVPTVPPAQPLNDLLAAPGSTAVLCVDSATVVSVDPSAGGPVYLSLPVTFNGAEAVIIRGVGLHLSPVSAP
jgi:hypothetical protein